jgi:hypothetical protein
MSPEIVQSVNRASHLPAVLLLLAGTGCASALRSGEYAAYDCLVVENETADAVSVSIDAGSYVVELGRIGPASKRALRLRRADLPERITQAYLRIVPMATPASGQFAAWPPPPGPLSQLIRTADTHQKLWRYTGRELVSESQSGEDTPNVSRPMESACSSAPPAA